MSSPFSKRMQGVATRLLGKFGSTVTLVRAGAKVWDASLGEYVQQPPTTIPLTAVPTPISRNLSSGIVNLMDKTTIQAGDMQVICDPGVVPAMEDKMLFNGDEWSIVAMSPSRVNDDVVAYFVLVRK